MKTLTPAGQTTCTICASPFFESNGGIHNVGRTCSTACARIYQQQMNMFDCTVKELEQIIDQYVKDGDDLVRVSMSMLSDIQEMLSMGMEKDTIRTAINRVKYILDAPVRKGGVR